MNAVLNQNQKEFSIFIFSILLKILLNRNKFLNSMLEILRKIRRKSFEL